MSYLTRLEEIFMLAIWRMKEDAYGVKIRKAVSEIAGKKMSYGAVYFTLDQLFKKGYLTRTVGEPTPVRGGCSKIYYNLSQDGKAALKASYELQQSIWDGVSVLSFE